VAGLEERVAFLEGRVVEHSHMLDGIREAIVHLEQRMDRRFELLEQRFAAIDQRFAAIDQRFASVDQRLNSLDLRIDGLDAKMSRQFMWLVGIQVTTLVAIVAALVAR
jgi:uncharacterized coiled-coil protein SlyX